MKHVAAEKTTNSVNGEPTLGLGGLAVAFLDTTWRIGLPVLLFTVIGIYADLHLGTKPWLTFVCVPVGFAIAVLLVKRLLAASRKLEGKS